MNKLHRLETFKKTAGTSLGRNAFRLYLLLLAGCDDDGKGEIPVATVRAALGKETNAAVVWTMVRELAAMNLVKACIRDGTNGENRRLAYTLQG